MVSECGQCVWSVCVVVVSVCGCGQCVWSVCVVVVSVCGQCVVNVWSMCGECGECMCV